MKKKELLSRVANMIRESGYRRMIKSPRHTFHISDDEGNTKDFIVQQSEKPVGLSMEDVEQVIEALCAVIHDAMRRGDPVGIVGFGTFGFKYRSPRSVPSFFGGERIEVDGQYIPYFKPGDKMKQACKIYTDTLKDRVSDSSASSYDPTLDPSSDDYDDEKYEE